MTFRDNIAIFGSLFGDLGAIFGSGRRLAQKLRAKMIASARTLEGEPVAVVEIDENCIRRTVTFDRLVALMHFTAGALLPIGLTLLLLLSRWWRGPGRGCLPRGQLPHCPPPPPSVRRRPER